MNLIHDVLIASVWPVTVAVLILILVLLFRSQIKNLIQSVTKAKIGANSIEFGQARVDAGSPEAAKTTAKQVAVTSQVAVMPNAKWKNVANVFWLGHDLLWTQQTALRGAPRATILHGLTQKPHAASRRAFVDMRRGLHLI